MRAPASARTSFMRFSKYAGFSAWYRSDSHSTQYQDPEDVGDQGQSEVEHFTLLATVQVPWA